MKEIRRTPSKIDLIEMLAQLGEDIRWAGKSVARWIESPAVDNGYVYLSAYTGFVGGCIQNGTNGLAAIADFPGTIAAVGHDIDTSIDYGQKYGWRIGVGRQIGVLAAVEGTYCIDLKTGDEIDWMDKWTEAGGRISATAGTLAVTFRLVGLGSVAANAGNAATNGTVWDSMVATQSVHEGTVIPRSFRLNTKNGSVWIHGHATKHLLEYANRGLAPELVKIGTQAQLTSLQAAIEHALVCGVEYEHVVTIGDWQLIISAPREAGGLPAVIHALHK